MHGEGQRWIGAEWGRVCGGVSPLQPTSGSWAEPRPKTDIGVFWRHETLIFVLIWQNLWGQFALSSPTPNSGGACFPCPPTQWSTPMHLESAELHQGQIVENVLSCIVKESFKNCYICIHMQTTKLIISCEHDLFVFSEIFMKIWSVVLGELADRQTNGQLLGRT